MKTDDDIEDAKTWRGEDIDCRSCVHAADLLPAGKCQLRRACVNDGYARRIVRFFNWNP